MQRRVTEIARFTDQPAEVARFYAQLLDCPVPGSHRHTVTFEIAGVSLFIHPSGPTGDAPTHPGWPENIDHIAIQVEDLDAECARLASAGHAITGPAGYPWGRAAYLYDPDGRMVELHEVDRTAG